MRGEKVMIQCRWWPGFYVVATTPPPSHSGALQPYGRCSVESAAVWRQSIYLLIYGLADGLVTVMTVGDWAVSLSPAQC